MAYVGMDLDQAGELAGRLHGASDGFDDVIARLDWNDDQVEIVSAIHSLLAQASDQLRSVASRVQEALHELESFHVQHTFAPSSSTPWNLHHQDASHNSYLVPGGIASLFEQGVRSFELDIHRGAPTNFTQPFSNPFGILGDMLDHEGGRDGDWLVYHHSADTSSEYAYLTQGLLAVASLDTEDPLTVFIDNKDAFAGAQSVQDFDALLRRTFGTRLLTPGGLIGSDPAAGSLAQYVQTRGWPTRNEMAGQVIVVLTDQIDGYRSEGTAAFIAPTPEFGTGKQGQVEHELDSEAVFYNAHLADIGQSELAALRATTSVVRTYGNPPCAIRVFDPNTFEVPLLPNYRAVDHGPGQPSCPAPMPEPTRGVVVPVSAD